MNKLITIIVLIILLAVFFLPRTTEDKALSSQVKVNDTVFNVEIADSLEERVKGLSGRENLSENEGLFFIFDIEDEHGIWMPDMNFSIDIVWINSEFKIVSIERNVSPETFPTVFYPQKKAKYVLETPSGTIGDNVKIGDKIIFYPQSQK